MSSFPKKFSAAIDQDIRTQRASVAQPPYIASMYTSALSMTPTHPLQPLYVSVYGDIRQRLQGLLGKHIKRQPVINHNTYKTYTIAQETHAYDVDMFGANTQQKFQQHLARLGIATGQESYQYTLGEQMTRLTRRVFTSFIKDGLIDQHKEVVYRDIAHQTAVSPEDVTLVPTQRKLYFIRYFVDTKKHTVVVPTTRPETIFADVAIAVHPLDKRYKKYVGKKVIIPIINKTIPVIADERVDMTKHTGAMRITPGHDATSVPIAIDHELPLDVYAIDKQGLFTDRADVFAGKEATEFTSNVVQYIEDIANLDDIQTTQVGLPVTKQTGQRLETLLSTQWFLDVEQLLHPMKPQSLKETNNKGSGASAAEMPAGQQMNSEDVHTPLPARLLSRQIERGLALPVWYDTNQAQPHIYDETMIRDARDKKSGLLLTLIIFNLIADSRLSSTFTIEELIDVLWSPSRVDHDRLTIDVYMRIYQDDKTVAKEYKILQKIIDSFDDAQAIADKEKIIDLLDDSFAISVDQETYTFAMYVCMGQDAALTQTTDTIDPAFTAVLASLFATDMPMYLFGGSSMKQTFAVMQAIVQRLHDDSNEMTIIIGHDMDQAASLSTKCDIDSSLRTYGADTCRLFIIGQGIYEEQSDFAQQSIGDYHSLLLKIRNAIRYVVTTTALGDKSLSSLQSHIEKHVDELTEFDKRMIMKVQELHQQLSDERADFHVSNVLQHVLYLVIEDFAMKYVNITKTYSSPHTLYVMQWTVHHILLALHPLVPFMTEKLRSLLGQKDMLLQQALPQPLQLHNKNYKIHLFMNMIKSLNTMKAHAGKKKHEKVSLLVQATPDFLDFVKQYESIFVSLTNASDVVYHTPDIEIGDEYITDHVIDITIGVRVVVERTKDMELYDLQKTLQQKQDYLQHLRTLLAAGSVNEEKRTQMDTVKEDIDELEYQIRKLKIG